jgi:hypothetical protein
MTTIMTLTGAIEVDAAAEGDDLWMTADDLRQVTGYELKPEGFCLDEVCVPVPRGQESEFVRGSEVNLGAFWRQLDAAIVHDEGGASWSIGEPPTERALRVDSLVAPDFTLPDAAGRPHSLSDYRGRKVLLAAWASW